MLQRTVDARCLAILKIKCLTQNEEVGLHIEHLLFYLGKRLLAVNSKNVIESIGIEELRESIEMDKKNHFKGMVYIKITNFCFRYKRFCTYRRVDRAQSC